MISRNRTFSNIYHKFLNGKTFWRGDNEEYGGRNYPDYFIGDKDGNPVGGTAWSIRCRSQWNAWIPMKWLGLGQKKTFSLDVQSY